MLYGNKRLIRRYRRAAHPSKSERGICGLLRPPPGSPEINFALGARPARQANGSARSHEWARNPQGFSRNFQQAALATFDRFRNSAKVRPCGAEPARLALQTAGDESTSSQQRKKLFPSAVKGPAQDLGRSNLLSQPKRERAKEIDYRQEGDTRANIAPQENKFIDSHETVQRLRYSYGRRLVTGKAQYCSPNNGLPIT